MRNRVALFESFWLERCYGDNQFYLNMVHAKHPKISLGVFTIEFGMREKRLSVRNGTNGSTSKRWLSCGLHLQIWIQSWIQICSEIQLHGSLWMANAMFAVHFTARTVRTWKSFTAEIFQMQFNLSKWLPTLGAYEFACTTITAYHPLETGPSTDRYWCEKWWLRKILGHLCNHKHIAASTIFTSGNSTWCHNHLGLA